MRNILVTTWRSGSTFVADVINSVPANFYHYEPLLNYEIVQIRGPPMAEEAMNIIQNLLNCNYAPLGRCKYFTKRQCGRQLVDNLSMRALDWRNL